MTIEFRHPRKGEEAALRRLWTQAFGEEGEFLDLFFHYAYAPDRCRVADCGGIAAMLYWFRTECMGRKVAYLYAVAADRRCRGQGIATALLEDTHALLKEQGYAGTILVPGEPSLFRFYEKRGYRVAGTVGEGTFEAKGPAVPCGEITGAEYAALRREYLPENGVIQEQESLALLERSARFCAGEGFLAAVAPVGEWLGDGRWIPGMLAGLGIPRARFRFPGNGRDFAMANWFDPDFSPETVYFSFAFD